MELNIKNKKDRKKIKCIGDALSNINRLAMLTLIKKNGGNISHREIAEELGIKSSSVTFHLSSLIDAGLISQDDGVGMLGRKSKTPKLTEEEVIIKL